MENEIKREIPPLSDAYTVTLHENDTTESFGDRMAEMIISPITSTERIIKACEKESGLAFLIHSESLRRQIDETSGAIKAGDMGRVEEMLVDQAISLQALFTRLGERALGFSDHKSQTRLIGVALRAQDQSRRTLETLGAIKNPTVVFAKQANVATNQQINNGIPAPARDLNEQSRMLEKIATTTPVPAPSGQAEVSHG